MKLHKHKSLRNYFNFNSKFSQDSSIQSDSDDGRYIAAISKFVANSKQFQNFKRNSAYNAILEHVSKDLGLAYLDRIKNVDEAFLEKALGDFLVNDSVGNPKKFLYDEGLMSPTSLRYVKVALDLKLLFRQDLEHVAEIGCGYGGQCHANSSLLSYTKHYLFDLPEVNRLVSKYLNSYLINTTFSTHTINEYSPQNQDLIISNYAFSELPRLVQEKYFEKVISQAQRGYMIMNTGLDKDDDRLGPEFFRAKFPNVNILKEEPLTSSKNYLIVWGIDKQENVARFFNTLR